jgi:hypothetical protein
MVSDPDASFIIEQIDMFRVKANADHFTLFLAKVALSTRNHPLFSPLYSQHGVLAGVFEGIDGNIQIAFSRVNDVDIVSPHSEHHSLAIYGVNGNKARATGRDKHPITH